MSLMHVLIYTDNPRNSMLDMRGIWTSKLEEEYVEGAPSMAHFTVFSVYYQSGIEFSKEQFWIFQRLYLQSIAHCLQLNKRIKYTY
jgi:hypothetical protein